jgi:hypothetical protein
LGVGCLSRSHFNSLGVDVWMASGARLDGGVASRARARRTQGRGRAGALCPPPSCSPLCFARAHAHAPFGGGGGDGGPLRKWYKRFEGRSPVGWSAFVRVGKCSSSAGRGRKGGLRQGATRSSPRGGGAADQERKKTPVKPPRPRFVPSRRGPHVSANEKKEKSLSFLGGRRNEEEREKAGAAAGGMGAAAAAAAAGGEARPLSHLRRFFSSSLSARAPSSTPAR